MTAGRLLALLGAGFLVLLSLQRGASGFLAAEARTGEARALATENGLRVSEVLAWIELDGAADRDARVAALAAERRRLGDLGLAVLSLRGKLALAEQLRAEVGPGSSPGAVRAAIFAHREAVEDAVRFWSIAARFHRRGHDSR